MEEHQCSREASYGRVYFPNIIKAAKIVTMASDRTIWDGPYDPGQLLIVSPLLWRTSAHLNAGFSFSVQSRLEWRQRLALGAQIHEEHHKEGVGSSSYEGQLMQHHKLPIIRGDKKYRISYKEANAVKILLSNATTRLLSRQTILCRKQICTINWSFSLPIVPVHNLPLCWHLDATKLQQAELQHRMKKGCPKMRVNWGLQQSLTHSTHNRLHGRRFKDAQFSKK